MKQVSGFNPVMLAPLIAVLLGAALLVLEPLPLQVLRNAVFDQYQRWHPRPYQNTPVRIIDIDEESITRLGQWPWPRTRLAELIQRLQDDGAAVISLDMVFAEADRTSPGAVSAAWKIPADLRRRLESMPDHDDALASAIGRGRVVLGFAAKPGGVQSPPPARPFRLIYSGAPPGPFLHSFSGALCSLAVLENAAAGCGLLTFIPDSDGVVRRIPLMAEISNRVVPSLAAESLRVAQGRQNYIIRTSDKQGSGVQEIRIGDLIAPTTPGGEIWLHYSRPVQDRFIPAWKVLAGQVPREQVEGRIVLIGASAQGLMDLRFNSLGQVTPGVDVHAQAIEQILEGSCLRRPAWAGAIEALVIVIGGLLIALAALGASALVSAGVTLLILVMTGGAAWFCFARFGLLLDPVTPGLALMLPFLLGSLIHHRLTEKRQRWIREAFSRYVSPNRVAYLVSHPDQLELGGKRQECSFVFTDLAGFTSLMETLDPAKAVAVLNAYLDRMITIAFSHGGTLDRIVGDSVAIMFSAPVVQPDHCSRALACALEMHAFAASYSRELHAENIPFGQTRIGIHTGEVIVGNFGGATMFDYRALGDTVNTASRLEGANKYLGTLICLSEATLAGCPGAAVRPVGILQLKGKAKPLRVYEPITKPADITTKQDRDTAYEEAYDLLQKKDPQAGAAFERLAAKRPHDALVMFHLKRLQKGHSGDTIILEEK